MPKMDATDFIATPRVEKFSAAAWSKEIERSRQARLNVWALMQPHPDTRTRWQKLKSRYYSGVYEFKCRLHDIIFGEDYCGY